MRLPTGPDITPVNIFNPTDEDFICQRANDENNQETHIIPARQIATFPKYLADHVAHKLAQQITLVNTTDKRMYEIRLKETLDKIIVTL